jgi:N-methylhydantoinase A/oxoprolinase/acetone carboxylase beta subunit
VTLVDLGLGFDTGGTYTDAVLMDILNGKVIAKAKALTTRDDLSVGIKNSVKSFDKKLFRDVVMVSMSSTLATNSIVEGKGCRVGLISIGTEFDRSIPVDMYALVKGGHNLAGKETSPLDEAAAEESIRSMKGKVDGLAVTGFLSVRNPDHEMRVKKIAENILSVPVVCGHELSSSLGYNERTVTSVMNARLIPIIKDLIVSIKSVMNLHGIDAPLMIVKGDGSLMSESVAVGRPIETILSGPASSLIGAKILTSREDAIVIDIGGTTTDIGILRNGQPRLEKEGAVIGGKRTRVLAAEISTSGIGGDSRIVVNGGKFFLSPLRVVPLCVAAEKWPSIREKLRVAVSQQTRNSPESLDPSNILQDLEFFVKLKNIRNAPVSDSDMKLMALAETAPISLSQAGTKLDIHPFTFGVGRMEELGMIQRIGFTPTDVLRAEGTYREFPEEPSQLGAEYMARRMGTSVKEFIRFAKDKVITKFSEELLKKLFFEETGSMSMDTISEDLMRKAVSGREGLDYGCSIRLNKPIIGIGAPVGAYLPDVARKFNAELLLPEHSEVGNAVGAITGSVIETLDVLIRPRSGKGSADDPPCTVFSSIGRLDFDTISLAIGHIRAEYTKTVAERALKAGADYVDTKVDVKERKYALGAGFDAGKVLLEIEVKVTAVGKPRQFVHREPA